MTRDDRCWCGEKASQTLFGADGFLIVRCKHCDQVRVIAAGGRKKHYYRPQDLSVYVEKAAMFRILFARVLSFIKRYQDRGVFVDIGAGAGLLVDEARRLGYRAVGFEPSKAAVAVAKQQFGVKLDNREFQPSLVKQPADVVVINHVLEHLPDPQQMITYIHAVLRPRGLLVVGVPNFGSFLALLKRERWQSLIPDQHRWQFTLTSLDRLVVPFGFVRVGCQCENHDRSMHPWWKQPIYGILDRIALLTGRGEAILVAYRKV